MNISIDREILLENLNTIERGLAVRSPMPILTGIKLYATDTDLYMTSSNSDISVEVVINDQSLNIQEPGQTVVPGKVFIDIIRKINSKKIVDRLREIAKLENIAIDEDALYEIARISDGGMRDAINFLDQLVAYDNKVITLDDIYKVNGSVSYNDIYLLLKSIADNNKVEIIRFFDTFDSSGKDINVVC